jgi:hypothetical protein
MVKRDSMEYEATVITLPSLNETLPVRLEGAGRDVIFVFKI